MILKYVDCHFIIARVLSAFNVQHVEQFSPRMKVSSTCARVNSYGPYRVIRMRIRTLL